MMDKEMEMRPPRVLVVSAIVLVVAAGIVLSAWFVAKPILLPAVKAREAQVHLLCETDRHELLGACRELSTRFLKGDLAAGQYIVRSQPSPEVSTFPRIIIDLDPTDVYLDASGIVTIELFGFPSYGVIALPEGYRQSPHYQPGPVQLIPGLWYYDEDYDRNPEYKRRIDALIEKGG